MIRLLGIISLIFSSLIFVSCDSSKGKLQEKIQQMQSSKVLIPYEQMSCWATDSLESADSGKKAKLKLIHDVDSAQCSTCYLLKITMFKELFDLEKTTNNRFTNIFIIAPGIKDKKRLLSEYMKDLLPHTIFVDTAHVFVKSNPHIPEENMFHTFLLDDSDNVVLVGNPITNSDIKKIFYNQIKEISSKNK